MNTDLLFENARLQGRVITLEAEVKCLEAVVRAHERVDCLRIKSLDEQLKQAEAEVARLKAEVERLTADLNKMTKTPEGVDYVEVDVGFWTKSGSRLPSSYSTFWSNDKGVQS